jgi:hypothetical protein
VALGECPYCGKVVPTYEKAADGTHEVVITAPGQRVVVNFLKAQHERAKGHMGTGCLLVIGLGGGGGLAAWYIGSRLGHPIATTLVTVLVAILLGIVQGMRDDRLLCENEIVPALRRLMAEEGVSRAEAQRLASEALPKDSTLLQAVMSRL